ncbi:AsnC family protein [Bacillus paranthracis]|uniref:AsnC family protein n=1 Tax=Bacillus paranthracis TaxID=2026186 RepID=UPI001E60229B|nr:AsnC family protein [Bacillus paranthracis]MCD1182132.1 AsnC family protein [Bacillus paranthracis]HDR4568999.1 AsnC family protein [Bacillus paranthracis]
MLAIRKHQESFIDEWHECYLSEHKKSGYIAVLDLSGSEKKQLWIGTNDIKTLSNMSNPSNKDFYLSLNSFVFGSRKATDLKQIRNIGVDLDFYKLDISKEYVIQNLQDFIAEGMLPCPNLVMYGRGMQLIYTVQGGAAPQMAFLSQYITNHFIKMLMPLGADGSCSDLSRVLRMPYTTHSKTGKQIELEIWTRREHDLQELYDYVPPLEKKRKIKRKKASISTLPSQKGVMNLYSLNTKRKSDLEKIVALRNGEIEHRHDMTYIYAFTTALIVKNQTGTLEMTFQLNDKFKEPQKKKEVERTAKDAYRDAIKFFDAFAENGFTMRGLPSNLIKPMKTETIFNKLDIKLTKEELEVMDTLIDSEEIKHRDKLRKRKARGSVSIEEHKAAKTNEKDQKIKQLKELLTTNPKLSQRKIAKIMGISESYIRKLKQKI